MDKTLKLVFISLTLNVAFAIYHLVLGLTTNSWWLLTLGSYYLFLSVVRAVVLRYKTKERFITKFTGWTLIVLSIPLVGTVILAVVRDRGNDLHMIVMIAMATYAFTKITLAIINISKTRGTKNYIEISLRSINLIDASVSILALQTALLTEFSEPNTDFRIANGLTGSAVFLFTLALGIFMIIKAHTEIKNERNRF